MRVHTFATLLAAASSARALLSADTGADGGAAAPSAASSPPEAAAAEPAAKAVRPAHVVWASPGHHTFTIGQVVRTSADMADALRARGHARPASKDEVDAAKKSGRDIPSVG